MANTLKNPIREEAVVYFDSLRPSLPHSAGMNNIKLCSSKEQKRERVSKSIKDRSEKSTSSGAAPLDGQLVDFL